MKCTSLLWVLLANWGLFSVSAFAVDVGDPYTRGQAAGMPQTRCADPCDTAAANRDPGTVGLCKALTTIMNDPRCATITKAKQVELGRSRGLGGPGFGGAAPTRNCAITLDPNSSGFIGLGKITLTLSDGSTIPLGWDGGHILTPNGAKTQDDWLYGRQGVGGVGFYQQLIASNVCRANPVSIGIPPKDPSDPAKGCLFGANTARTVKVYQSKVVDMTSPNGKVICVANVACEGNDGGGTACDQKYCTQPDACANDTTVTNGPGGDITDDEITRAIKQNLGVSVSGPASPGGADATATPAN